MTRFTIEPPDHVSVRHIMGQARPRDRYEVKAVCGVWSPTLMADETVRGWADRGAWGGVFTNGEPIAVLTVLKETPVSLQVGLIATERFPEIAIGVTRHVRKVLGPMLREQGFTRAECRCWSGHDDARRWLAMCGAKEEAEIPGYGVNGETFIQMAWS